MHADKELITQIINTNKLDEDSIKQLAQFVANNQREIHHYYHKNKKLIQDLQGTVKRLEDELHKLKQQ